MAATPIDLPDGRTIDLWVEGPPGGIPLVFHHGTPGAGLPFEPMVRAIADRGVRYVGTSRAGYGELLKAGAEVYEYQPAMIHAKVLCVDDLWVVVGSTNFDNRSFGINDEVNLAIRNADVTMRFESDIAIDLDQSRRVSLKDWKHRPMTERVTELMGMIFERQQ